MATPAGHYTATNVPREVREVAHLSLITDIK